MMQIYKTTDSYHVDLQKLSSNSFPLSDHEIIELATLPMKKFLIAKAGELTLRFVDREEIKQLNLCFRKQNKTTNVLSFPSTLPPYVKLQTPFLGDVIICPQVLDNESKALKKDLAAHWAHIIIHGVLHLLGFDHVKDEDAQIMQEHEIKLLTSKGFSNPYINED